MEEKAVQTLVNELQEKFPYLKFTAEANKYSPCGWTIVIELTSFSRRYVVADTISDEDLVSLAVSNSERMIREETHGVVHAVNTSPMLYGGGWVGTEHQLTFYASVTGQLLKTVTLPKEMLATEVFDKAVEIAKELQTLAEAVNSWKYFVCSVCGQMKPDSELEETVFAGKYCKTCYETNPETAKVVNESRRPGFYE